MRLSFRQMVPDDADAVARVEAASFPVPWSRESFWREASNEHTCYVLACDEEAATPVIGYAGCWILAGEAQITARSSWRRSSRPRRSAGPRR